MLGPMAKDEDFIGGGIGAIGVGIGFIGGGIEAIVIGIGFHWWTDRGHCWREGLGFGHNALVHMPEGVR